jgi:NAD-dependent deacetylase
VYPAAGLLYYVRPDAEVYYIDPKPAPTPNVKVNVLPMKASEGVAELKKLLKKQP